MSTLLLQSCSASKHDVDTATPALELYSGYFYKILDKSVREDEFRPDLDIAILSAKYGLLNTDDEIESYDQKMDRERARELNDEVVERLSDLLVEAEYDRLVINMGKVYREAVSGLSERADTPIAEIPGTGIGEKGSAFYQFIRGDDTVVTVTSDL